MSIYDAAQEYINNNVDTVIIAGKEYGTGSSRDWAAKGTRLLGVRAVIAESFERIHRSNLIGMGVLPLEFMNNENKINLNMTCFVMTYKREIRKWTNIRTNNLLLFKVYIHHILDKHIQVLFLNLFL